MFNIQGKIQEKKSFPPSTFQGWKRGAFFFTGKKEPLPLLVDKRIFLGLTASCFPEAAAPVGLALLGSARTRQNSMPVIVNSLLKNPWPRSFSNCHFPHNGSLRALLRPSDGNHLLRRIFPLLRSLCLSGERTVRPLASLSTDGI